MAKIIITIGKVLELVNQVGGSELDLYDALNVVEKGKLWKKKGFYDNSDYDAEIWMKMEFEDFIKGATYWTYQRYRSIKNMFEIFQDAREKYLKYGRGNMVTLINCDNDKQRFDLLIEVEDYIEKNNTIPVFTNIKKKLWSKSYNKKPIVSINENYKKKYEEVLKEKETLEIENERLKIENEKLKIAFANKLLANGKL